ncbi:hypothetical protein INS49_007756 [Diaporthe citri]|uniref:uncharacterized protein n=1 Tax=Diaporthe citri TaxID=83186 RepID=UPI001C80AB4F|nr:uncharacterized protein INS49_007756 [Diaporthe citri]KAG6362664.1 hypothetical protein INS49_007756 [Diaporthe citri]
MSFSLRTSFILLAATSAAADLYTEPCPLYGQNYPAPTGLANSKHVEAAAQSVLNQLLKARNETTAYGPLDTETTAFSVEFYSLDDEDALFRHHYTPTQLLSQRTAGVEEVDSDTIYRVGSVSKLWTVYLYLLAAGDTTWNDPITKFIPELQEISQTQQPDPTSDVDWESITVGALASHLAGIGRDPTHAAALTKVFGDLGIPSQSDKSSSSCGDPTLVTLPCNRSHFPTQHPIVASYETPVYSNSAFQILSYALENITGQPMHDLFNQHLVEPLNLKSTSYHLPSTPDTSIIPYNTSISWWFADLLDLTPAGGYFSTANDMRKIGKAMLGSTQLDPSATRRWMKPHSFLSNRDAAAGAPWEIYRAPGEPTMMMMTKAGDLGMYSSYVVLIPELKLGFTVLSAGESASENTRILGDILVDTFVPAARSAASDEVAEVYAGSFSDGATGSNITLVGKDTEPGLSVEEWSFSGQDVLSLLGKLKGANITARLYYSGLESETPNGTVSAWRAVYQTVTRAVGPGPLSPICDSWFTVDGLAYGGVGLDEFLVTTVEGKATSIEPRVLGIPMSRIK